MPSNTRSLLRDPSQHNIWIIPIAAGGNNTSPVQIVLVLFCVTESLFQSLNSHIITIWTTDFYPAVFSGSPQLFLLHNFSFIQWFSTFTGCSSSPECSQLNNSHWTYYFQVYVQNKLKKKNKWVVGLLSLLLVTVLSSRWAVLFPFLFLTLGKIRLPEFLSSWLSPALRKEQTGRPDLLLDDIAESWQKFSCCFYNFILLLSIQYLAATALKNKLQLFCSISPGMTASMENMKWQNSTFSWGAKHHQFRFWLTCKACKRNPTITKPLMLLCRNCCVKLGSWLTSLISLLCNRRIRFTWSLLGLSEVHKWVAVDALADLQGCCGSCGWSHGQSRSMQGWGQRFSEQLIGNVLSIVLCFYHYN